jgi:two-component sensor histidine kinase
VCWSAGVELIANAIQAAASRIRLDVELHHDRLVVAVLDDAPGWPVPRRAATDATSGRGLAIIEALSEQRGATPDAVTGKKVWPTLPIAIGVTTSALICAT